MRLILMLTLLAGCGGKSGELPPKPRAHPQVDEREEERLSEPKIQLAILALEGQQKILYDRINAEMASKGTRIFDDDEAHFISSHDQLLNSFELWKHHVRSFSLIPEVQKMFDAFKIETDEGQARFTWKIFRSADLRRKQLSDLIHLIENGPNALKNKEAIKTYEDFAEWIAPWAKTWKKNP